MALQAKKGSNKLELMFLIVCLVLVALECVTMECLMDMLAPKLLSLQLNTCTRTLCSSFQKVDGKLMANFSLLIDLLLVIFYYL